MELTTGVFGEITIEKIKRNGATEKVKFKNLITNNGLIWLATLRFSEIVSGCYLGTGATEPTITDIDLTNRSVGTANTGGISQSTTRNVETGVTSRRWSFYFDFGELNGNYSEIGFGRGRNPIDSNGGSTLFSKALIKDANGNPSVLTVMSDEALRIHYTLFMKPDLEPKEGSFVLGGNLGKNVNYIAKTVGWGETAPYGLRCIGIMSQFETNRVNGIVRAETKNYLLGLSPFDPVLTSELSNGFTSGLRNDTTNAPTIYGSSLIREPNAMGPGISRFSFLVSIAQWNVSSREIHGLLLTFHDSGSAGSGIIYAILFNEPIIKDNEKRLGFTITHGWGRV